MKADFDREKFLIKSTKTLGAMVDALESLPSLELKNLKADSTVLIIIDMLNGFTREGALQSPRINMLTEEVARLLKACRDEGIRALAMADCHTESSPELQSYPAHCLAGSSESQVVREIREIGGYTLIPKNSTNGFLEREFQQWLAENPGIDTFIITGDCTDICIEQFSLTLKAYFNMRDMKSRVIVPVNAVDTFDAGLHDGDLMHVVALFMMMNGGIEIVREVR